jgi:hypothetical protein
MSTTDIRVGSVDLLDVITKDRELPEGYDQWAIRTVRPDLRSRNNYRYPFPGKVAKAAGPFSEGRDECPSHDGDGICAATTWQGMASGGVTASTLLLVAYKEKHVLGGSRSGGKLRLRRFLVVDVIDGLDLLRKSGKGANLSGANLYGANLYGANLSGANFSGANLYGANLRGANLSGANLSGADLRGANLYGANLRGANLRGADLSGADLSYVNLSGADLSYANLRGANLRGADLRGANLRGAKDCVWVADPVSGHATRKTVD